jgi:8-oxo-dGTP diphosphatase
MKKLTICYLIKEGQILLAMKKRGFGVNKWNGVGGKQEVGETVEEAAIREVKEEIEVSVNIQDLRKVAKIKFYFSGKKEWNQEVYVYFVEKWKGNPSETEEMKPQWFTLDQIPYKEMWVADEQWLSRIIKDEKVVGEVYFNKDGSKVKKIDIRKI